MKKTIFGSFLTAAFLALSVGASSTIYADEAPVWDYHMQLLQVSVTEGIVTLTPVADKIVPTWDACLTLAQSVNVVPTGFAAVCIPFVAKTISAAD